MDFTIEPEPEIFKDHKTDSLYYRTRYNMLVKKWMNCQQCILEVRDIAKIASETNTPIDAQALLSEVMRCLSKDKELKFQMRAYANSLTETCDTHQLELLDSLYHFGKQLSNQPQDPKC